MMSFRGFVSHMEGYKQVIDSLHLRNHVDTFCKEQYSSAHIKEKNPFYNTMVCEKTFAWLIRYKRIIGSMPKIHFHFFYIG